MDIDDGTRRDILAFIHGLADREYETLAALTKNVRLTANEIRSAVESDGRTIIRPPDGRVPDGTEVTEVGNTDRRTFHLSVPLWTAEAGLSNLRLEMRRVQFRPGERFWLKEIHGI